MKQVKFFTLLLFLITLMQGCVRYEDVQFVSFDHLTVKNLSFTGFDLEITVTIENPNPYKIKIIDADIELEIAGKPVGRIVVPEKLVLDRRSKKQQKFLINTGLSKLSVSLIPALMAVVKKEKVRVKAVGSFRARAFAIGKKFLVDFDDDVSMEGSLMND